MPDRFKFSIIEGMVSPPSGKGWFFGGDVKRGSRKYGSTKKFFNFMRSDKRKPAPRDSQTVRAKQYKSKNGAWFWRYK